MITAAVARMVHRTLVSRRFTQRCLKRRVQERIVTLMTMPLVHLHVHQLIIPLHSALHPQGKDSIPLFRIFSSFSFLFYFKI